MKYNENSICADIFLESEIDLMESEKDFRSTVMLNEILFLEDGIGERLANTAKNVYESVKEFISKILESIKKLWASAVQKYYNAKFKSEMRDFRRKYAEHKIHMTTGEARKLLGPSKVFLMNAYKKDVDNLINAYTEAAKKLDTMDFKSRAELNEWCTHTMSSIDKATAKIRNVHLYSAEVRWETAYDDMITKSENAEYFTKANEALEKLTEYLRDHVEKAKERVPENKPLNEIKLDATTNIITGKNMVRKKLSTGIHKISSSNIAHLAFFIFIAYQVKTKFDNFGKSYVKAVDVNNDKNAPKKKKDYYAGKMAVDLFDTVKSAVKLKDPISGFGIGD